MKQTNKNVYFVLLTTIDDILLMITYALRYRVVPGCLKITRSVGLPTVFKDTDSKCGVLQTALSYFKFHKRTLTYHLYISG